MINLSRFSKMSFTELVSLPNNFIHTIYKLFVNDIIEKEKRQAQEEAEAKKEAAKQAKEDNMQFAGNMMKNRDSKDVANLRSMLAGNGVNGDDLEELIEELEDGG